MRYDLTSDLDALETLTSDAGVLETECLCDRCAGAHCDLSAYELERALESEGLAPWASGVPQAVYTRVQGRDRETLCADCVRS
jgi:hypothetical protein